MIDIPVATINERSPYLVTSFGQNSFLFKTRHGINYNVGFSQDYMVYEKEDTYQFYIVNMDHSHFMYDPDVFRTIEVILEVFFEQEPSILLYICDMIDNRQAVRNRLFKLWFDNNQRKDQYTIVNKTLTYEDITYFGAIIIKKSHPDHDSIIEQFNAFIANLPQKLDELQN